MDRDDMAWNLSQRSRAGHPAAARRRTPPAGAPNGPAELPGTRRRDRKQMRTGPARVSRGPGPGRGNGALAPQTVNELPQPHPPVAFGFLNVKPDPIIVVT